MILMLAFVTASAQTPVNPPATTIQYLGTPNPQNNTAASVTAPLGGIILKGTAISPVTGQPFRHLWVDDATSGICRIDPDLDSPGPYAINPATCLTGFAIRGGAMALDPVHNLLYFVDNQRGSQGVFRIGYLPAGDSGNGSLDSTSLFNLGGSPAGAAFPAGQTGCTCRSCRN